MSGLLAGGEVQKGRLREGRTFVGNVELVAGDVTVAWATLRMKLPGQAKWSQLTAFVIARFGSAGPQIVALEYGAD